MSHHHPELQAASLGVLRARHPSRGHPAFCASRQSCHLARTPPGGTRWRGASVSCLNAFDPLIEVGKRTAMWAVNEDDALTRGSFRVAVRHNAFPLLMRDIRMISVLLSDRLNMQRRARRPVWPPRRLQRLERMHTKIHRNAFESLLSRAAPVHLERRLEA